MAGEIAQPNPATGTPVAPAPASPVSPAPAPAAVPADAAPASPAAPALLNGVPADPKASAAAAPADPKATAPATDAKPADPAKPLELKVPEGFTADAPLLAAFKDLATKQGLKAEQAQPIVDLYAAQLKQEIQAQATERAAQDKAFVEQIKKDPELGGDKFESSIRLANIGLEKVGGKALVKAINDAGIANNPDVVRAFFKVGQLVSEDRIAGTNGAAPKNSEEQQLRAAYPTMFPA